MRAHPINDFFAQRPAARGQSDGAHLVLVQVKKPEESFSPWDYYKIRRTSRATRRSVRPIRTARW
jgi:hypothetical protein